MLINFGVGPVCFSYYVSGIAEKQKAQNDSAKFKMKE